MECPRMVHLPRSTKHDLVLGLITAALAALSCACVAAVDPPDAPAAERSAAGGQAGVLSAGKALKPGQSVASPDGRLTLTLQGDGNLVLYRQGGLPLWSTKTTGAAASHAMMQQDGNFVLYAGTGAAVWNTKTHGHPGAYLALQNDGNLVIYAPSGQPLWATYTAVLSSCPAGGGNGPLGGSRPTALKVPAGYVTTKRYPLVIELHGRGGTGADAEAVFSVKALADKNQLFVIAPDGTLDVEPASFWNGTDGCCNLYGSSVDDVAYLRSLICWTYARYPIDPRRVFIIGGSNGGFMAHRMACDAADLVSGIISVAGAVWNDPTRCKPSRPVNVLQIHGSADSVVPYQGVAAFAPGPVPSAAVTYETWAAHNGCSGPNSAPRALDLDASVAGAETRAVSKAGVPGCKARTELWTVQGGKHTPAFVAGGQQVLIDWLLNIPTTSPPPPPSSTPPTPPAPSSGPGSGPGSSPSSAPGQQPQPIETYVHALYATVLRRAADPGGLSYHTAQYASGATRCVALTSVFLLSSEAQALQSALSTADFVAYLYPAAFGRPGDAAGVAYWMKQLGAGAVTRAGVVQCFLATSEVAARCLKAGLIP